MGSIEIFENYSNVLIALSSLLVLLIATVYVNNVKDLNKGAWFLFSALALGLLVSYISYKFFHATKGVSLSTFVFFELTLLLISMILLAFAASRILDKELSNMHLILGIAGIGLISIIYFVILFPDGGVVTSMRNIFPIAGLVYISASLGLKAVQGKKKGYIGYMIAALTTSILAFFQLLQLLSSGSIDIWYINPISYTSLAISFFIIKSDSLSQNIKEYKVKIDEYNQRIEDIIKSSPFPIIISRLSDDRLILANNNAVKLFGIHQKEIERYKLKDFFADKENRQALNERLEQQREVQDFEILVKTTTGNTPFWLLTSANIIDYNYDIAIYAAFQDITSRKTRENLLKNQATRDPLTALYNRRYFEDEVTKRITQSLKDDMDYSVLMVDADHFKKINDTYGHKTGDAVLIDLAQTCEKALREDDIVARYGGEEFVIFLSKVNAEKAQTVAERLRQSIAKRLVRAEDGAEVKFTVSIGISSSAVSDNIETLIKTADEALYKAKSNGRNRSEIFTAKDLKGFQKKSKDGKKTASRHPVFEKEDDEEISLLDGVAAGGIIGTANNIEDEK